MHVLQDPPRHRAGDESRRHLCGTEQPDHLAAPLGRVPEGEVEHHAGEEAGLEHAEQEAHHVELGRGLDEHGRAGDQAPEHHDAHQGDPRAEPLQEHVARHLEEHVADEEHGGTEAVDRVAEVQRGLHLQLGEADVGAVDEVHQVADEQEWDQAQGDLAIDGVHFGGRALIAGGDGKGGHGDTPGQCVGKP
ncbi:hypothetical protein D3C85_1199100 [compost metagenome]